VAGDQISAPGIRDAVSLGGFSAPRFFDVLKGAVGFDRPRAVDYAGSATRVGRLNIPRIAAIGRQAAPISGILERALLKKRRRNSPPSPNEM